MGYKVVKVKNEQKQKAKAALEILRKEAEKLQVKPESLVYMSTYQTVLSLYSIKDYALSAAISEVTTERLKEISESRIKE